MPTSRAPVAERPRDAPAAQRQRLPTGRLSPPAPEQVLRRAGRPLEPSVRREMEGLLGFDFAQVRIHSDAEAAALTALIGADAVAVGSDVFFADGAYRPGTAVGRRLLAHELLHTAQVREAPAGLRLGRVAGALSRRLDAVESEAEESAEETEVDRSRLPGAQPSSWLRFISIDVLQQRAEVLDPATLVDRLVAGVVRSLRGDPADASGRVRQQLARLAPELCGTVVERLEQRLPTAEYARVQRLLADVDTPAGQPPDVATVPGPVVEASERIQQDRAETNEASAEDREHDRTRDADQPAEAEQEARDADDERRRAAEEEAAGPLDEQHAADLAEEERQRQEDLAGRADDRGVPPPEQVAPGEQASAPPQAPAEDRAAPVGPGPSPDAAAPAAPTTRAAAAATSAGAGAGPVPAPRPEAAVEIATAADGPLARHGVLARRPDEVPEQEKPAGLAPDATSDVDVPEPVVAPEDPAPQRDPADLDPVPKTDPDLSGVPTLTDELGSAGSGELPRPRTGVALPTPPPVDIEPDALDRARQAERDQVAHEEAADAEDAGLGGTESVVDVEGTGAAGPVAQAPGPMPRGLAAAPEPPGPSTRPVPEEPGPHERMPGDPGLADPEPARPDVAGAPSPGAGAGPEGSLEPGGGGCGGGPEATGDTETEQGGGGCGGGGGGSAGAPPAARSGAPAPDLADQEPKSALATAATLPAARVPDALGGVDRAVGTAVEQEHTVLAASPPEVARPVGAPRTATGPPTAAAPVETTAGPAEVVTPDVLARQRTANPPSTPATGNPGALITAPHVAGGTGDAISEAEAQAMQTAVNDIQTADARLYTTVGPAPKVRLVGETDPALADEQKRRTDENVARQREDGRRDAAVPMGEDQIYPTVPPETLTAQVPALAEGGAGGAATADRQVDPDTLSIVTAQEKDGEIRAGVADGAAGMAEAETEKATGSAQARDRTQADIEAAEAGNAAEQAAERDGAGSRIDDEREQWRREQDARVAGETGKADAEYRTTGSGIAKEKHDADTAVERDRDAENKKIEAERRGAEDKARTKKREKKEESKSWIGRAKAAVKSAFAAIASAITGIFDAAVRAVNKIKDEFKKVVNKLIDLAATAITGLIKAHAAVLLAVVDALLAAFPELRQKFRQKIEEWRDRAVAKVQEYAEKLKKAVSALIDALAGLLVAYLDAYRKLLLFAVDLVRSAVDRALSAIEALISFLAEFGALAADIAPDPLGWLGNLGTAAREGTTNHLWGELKSHVRAWFGGTVEGLLALPKMLWNALVKGCFSVAKIGKMAWRAIVGALPAILMSLVIEKVVSLIVPAAGAVLLIIQGLRAAWGAISQIIAALRSFLDFLKSVKAGGAVAACNFAVMVAKGAVALLAVIANFLIIRLGKALKSLSGSLRGIAEKLIKALGRGAKAVRASAGRAVNAARGMARTTVGAVRRGARGVARAAAALRRRTARVVERLGPRLARSSVGRTLLANARKVGQGARKARQKLTDARRRRRDRRDARKARKREEKTQRLTRIVTRLEDKLQPRVQKGIRSVLLRPLLAGLRAWYRLSGLRHRGAAIAAELNPKKELKHVLEQLKLPRMLSDLGVDLPGSVSSGPTTGQILISGEPLIAQAGSITAQFAGVKNATAKKTVPILYLGSPSGLTFGPGYSNDRGGRLIGGSGQHGTYQDEMIRTMGMSDPSVAEMIRGIGALDAGLPLAPGHISRMALYFSLLRAGPEALRDARMGLIAPAERRYLVRGPRHAYRERVLAVLSYGLQSPYGSGIVRRNMDLLFEHAKRGGTLDHVALDDRRGRSLLNRPWPSLLARATTQQAKVAMRHGLSRLTSREAEQGVETPRNYLWRNFYWVNQLSEVIVAASHKQALLDEMRRFVDKTIAENRELRDPPPGWQMPKKVG